MSGTVFKTSGRKAQTDNLTWREVLVPLWVAERDWYGNELIAEE